MTKEVVQSTGRKPGEAHDEFSRRMNLGYQRIVKAEARCGYFDRQLKKCCMT
jgi:hypothetical protein